MNISPRAARNGFRGAAIFLALLCTVTSALADATRLSLNGTWQFRHAATAAEAEKLAGFFQPGYTARGFRPIPVPANWALHGFEEPTYKKFPNDLGPEGFYLHHFTVPTGWNDRRTLLHFDGVWDSAEVWLNGKPLGRHDSGFTGFAFEVTDGLKPGADNQLAVRVRQTPHAYGMDTNDDWTLGGIYRDVTLEAMPRERWLDSVIVQTRFDDQFRDADLNVRVMVGDEHKKVIPGNYVGPGTPYALRLTLRDMQGREVQQRNFPVPGHYGTSRETSATLRVADAHHWTAETPYLYQLRVELLEDGKVVHERSEKVGVRQVSTAGGVFRINGQAVKLRGVNRHDEHPDVGRATRREHWLQDIRLMKDANVNFIRFAHYPPAKGFIDLCDELGMYVGNEVAMGYTGDHLNDPAYAGAVMLRSYATVARDLNHPSIVYWSIGNEDPLTSLHMASLRAVKAWDPTRPVLLPWRAEHWLPPEVDIMAPHYWTARENSEFTAASTRPVITTEFTHAYGDQGFGGLNDRWRALIAHPAGAGGAIWMWADQGLKYQQRQADGSLRSTFKVTPDGWDGIVDAYRNPTRDFWETKAVYAQVYPAAAALPLAPGQRSIAIPIRNDYDFTDLGAVKIDWTLMADDRPLASGAAALAAAPHTTADAQVPLAALDAARPDETRYVRFKFSRADGSEITSRSVELLPAAGAASAAPSVASAAPAAAVTVEQGDRVTVRAGAVAYVFDPKTGQLGSATVNGRAVLAQLRPALWRKLNGNETVLLKAEERAHLADLDKYEAAAIHWNVRQEPGAAHLGAQVRYTVDGSNHFTYRYEYLVRDDGTLSVDYTVQAEVAAPWLPFVGMRLEAAAPLATLRWLGLGPLDAYPNESAAAILGVWSGALDTPAMQGVKSARWAELTDGAGTRFKVTGPGFIDTATGDGRSIRILSAVAGRGSKGRLPEGDTAVLTTGEGHAYRGQFIIKLVQ